MDSDALRHRLLAHNVTPTTQRLAVASVLLERAQHLSADQIQAALRQAGQRVSKATVYNTLRLFSRQGLVREVIVDPSRVFYDSTTHAHHHFFNVDTGELSDIAPGGVAVNRLAELPPGTRECEVEVLIRVRSRR